MKNLKKSVTTEGFGKLLNVIADSKVGIKRKIIYLERILYGIRYQYVSGLKSFLFNPDLKFGDEFITEGKTYKYVTSYHGMHYIVLDVKEGMLINILIVKTKDEE